MLSAMKADFPFVPNFRVRIGSGGEVTVVREICRPVLRRIVIPVLRRIAWASACCWDCVDTSIFKLVVYSQAGHWKNS
jgi:hypothetical protein